jgi:hypothetical protein
MLCPVWLPQVYYEDELVPMTWCCHGRLIFAPRELFLLDNKQLGRNPHLILELYLFTRTESLTRRGRKSRRISAPSIKWLDSAMSLRLRHVYINESSR